MKHRFTFGAVFPLLLSVPFLFSGCGKNSEEDKEKKVVSLNVPKFHMGEFCPYPSSGFSALEGTHTWTEGMKASITLPLKDMEHRPSRISFLNTEGFVTDNHTQDLIVKVNGEELGRYTYTLSNNNQTLDIPLPKADAAEIEFNIPNAASPSDLGISDDKRKLGIEFKEVQLQY